MNQTCQGTKKSSRSFAIAGRDDFWIVHEKKGKERRRSSGEKKCCERMKASRECLDDEASMSLLRFLIASKEELISTFQDFQVVLVGSVHTFGPRAGAGHVDSLDERVSMFHFQEIMPLEATKMDYGDQNLQNLEVVSSS